MRWRLPEAIEDMLPLEALRVESLRRLLLDGFARHGYQLVMPPLLEYVDSLLTGSGHDLDLRTFKLVDQLSGRTMGIRADITPQVARIDAHLLNRSGVTRLCYCGSVLHTLPSGFNATREPLQIGAELYGHDGIEADIEIIRLLADALTLAKLPAARIDLGHVGLFRTLARVAGFDAETEESVFSALQSKDVPTLQELVRTAPEEVRKALLALPGLYGGSEVLAAARDTLPTTVGFALDELERLARSLAGLPISFDLSDLRGYHYHSGIVFAAYAEDVPSAVALGGRYDMVGQAYGRPRPATGFSMDLRQLAQRAEDLPEGGGILAPASNDPALREEILRLRASGTVVVEILPGHDGTWHESGCTRQLVKQGTTWVVGPIRKE